jgi:hypothetical protein
MANCVTYVSGNATIVTDGERREEALKVLEKVKKERKGKNFILVSVDKKTYKEIEVKQESCKQMKKSLKKQ